MLNVKSHLKMNQKVRETLEKNTEKWKNISAFSRIYNQFTGNLDKLLKLSEKIDGDAGKRTFKKNELAGILIGKTMPIANILEVYGSDNNTKLAKAVKTTKEKLLKSKDKIILKKCELVLTKGKKAFEKAAGPGKNPDENKKSTARDYGLTQEMLKELDNAFAAYTKESSDYKKIARNDKKITKQIKLLAGKNNKLLRKKLDKLMVIFESKDAEFYASYEQSRKPEQSGKKSKITEPTAPVNETTVAQKNAAAQKSATVQKNAGAKNNTTVQKKQAEKKTAVKKTPGKAADVK